MKTQVRWLALALMAGLLACTAKAPQKPGGLGTETFWVGDRKGGVFVLLGPKDHEGWRVKIYDDRTGAVKADGLFTLRGIARAEINKEELVAYDGRALRLADGATLAPKVTP